MKKLQLPMKILSILTLTFMIAVVLPVMSTEAAALIDIGVTGSGSSATNVNTYTGTKTNTDVKTDVNVDADASVDSNTGAGTSGSTGTAGNVTTHVFTDGESVRVLRRNIPASTNANTNAQLNANENSVINIMPERVSTSADLKAYASNTMREDANIEEMNFTQNMIELGYKGRGKLLSMFPVVVTVKAVANADGKVRVNYPWYSFLVSKNKADLEAKLQAALSDALSARAHASAQATESMSNAGFSASEAADIAVRMHSVLRDAFSADTQASSTVSAK